MKLFSAKRKPVEELYDVEADPHEVKNLAADPAFQKVLGELRAALTKWQLEIGDLGLVPESEILRREKAAGSAYDILPGAPPAAAGHPTSWRAAKRRSCRWRRSGRAPTS